MLDSWAASLLRLDQTLLQLAEVFFGKWRSDDILDAVVDLVDVKFNETFIAQRLHPSVYRAGRHIGHHAHRFQHGDLLASISGCGKRIEQFLFQCIHGREAWQSANRLYQIKKLDVRHCLIQRD